MFGEANLVVHHDKANVYTQADSAFNSQAAEATSGGSLAGQTLINILICKQMCTLRA
jgi:hypothetical protein